MLTACCILGIRHCMTSQAGNISFIRQALWPSNSPNLNLIYYKIWDVIQQRVFTSQVHNIDEQKQWLLSVWHGTNNITENAADEWCDHPLSHIWRNYGNVSNCYDSCSIQLCHKMVHFFVTHDTMFKCICDGIYKKFELLNSQGTAVT